VIPAPSISEPAGSAVEGLQHFFSAALVAPGILFVLAGAIGVIRFPDVYTRAHAAGLTDSAGAFLVLAGLAVSAPSAGIALKLGLVALFIFLTSPTACHAIANAAFATGELPVTGRWRTTPPATPPEERA
jgi:multicomponent Na+:H+ antiporter subunit G